MIMEKRFGIFLLYLINNIRYRLKDWEGGTTYKNTRLVYIFNITNGFG
jgi:hypothetical protein